MTSRGIVRGHLRPSLFGDADRLACISSTGPPAGSTVGLIHPPSNVATHNRVIGESGGRAALGADNRISV